MIMAKVSEIPTKANSPKQVAQELIRSLEKDGGEALAVRIKDGGVEVMLSFGLELPDLLMVKLALEKLSFAMMDRP